MLKLIFIRRYFRRLSQPPSGGCVLKPYFLASHDFLPAQPPSGGCVLKPPWRKALKRTVRQPPSGGCVLKLKRMLENNQTNPSRLRAAVC